ncbi:hypothetical protein J2794_005769 [Paraburkholderia terricola]|uniref:DUF4160 domain-containing protein n=1 Tax=Paraburkholderia terricola TaxID=169427 RepID=UPI00285C85E5|nr:DUF4160 domain-containing protein [Paraburkholderia terricola]MDR6449631.1 hypothetical protein [Paraburkholderia terricola]
MQHNVVWLTSDQSSDGHGLLTGKEVPTESSLAYMARVEGRAVKNKLTYDKTQVRLAVDIPEDDPALRPFVTWAKAHEGMQWAKRMGLSAVMDLSKTTRSLTELALRTRTKEKTWWLYFGAVAPERIVKVDFQTRSGFERYEFEAHGRQALHDARLVVASESSLLDLQAHFVPLHPLDRVKAFAINAKPNEAPSIQIRGDGYHFIFQIDSGKQIYGAVPENLAALQSWIARHSGELMQCWHEATEVYRRYYPEPSTGQNF